MQNPSPTAVSLRASLTTVTLAVLSLTTVGCSSAPVSTTANPSLSATVLHIDPIVLAELVCPVTGETVTVESASAYFECYPVYCFDRASARQFASLEVKQRARLGAEQVLAQKGIANTTCPLSGETLTAAASPALFEGEVIGFASLADANQFRSLPAEKRAKLIAQWKA
ncbi:MAG: hypothetical protein ACKO3W_09925, partial [bacterium]